MKKILLVSLCLVLCVSLAASLVLAKDSEGRYATYKPHQALEDMTFQGDTGQLRATAVADTVYLLESDYDSPPVCTDDGWTRVDVTEQIKEYWHIATGVGAGAELDGGQWGTLFPIHGDQSLWLGQDATTTPPWCGYGSLPGYGNSWNQSFCTTNCVNVGLGASISMVVQWDSEPGYDATTLEATNCVGNAYTDLGFVPIYGGLGTWDGLGGPDTLTIPIPDSLTTNVPHESIRVRFKFVSDGAWSDEDGLWPTDGAFMVDDLELAPLALEDFEGETPHEDVGAGTTTDSGDWSTCSTAGYGDFSGLYVATTQVIEDPCASNITCVWGWFNGSTVNYNCGGFPGQLAVPYINDYDQYINNEIWSPWVLNGGAGSAYEIAFDVYRDLPLDNLIFYVWHVRTRVAGCPSLWADDNFVFYGEDKDWLVTTSAVGHLIPGGLTASDYIQVALGVVDMCPFWCGIYGTGNCHSHTPLIDNFRLYRINTAGAQWNGRDIDMFQDNFSEDGSITGTARIDMAQDILQNANPNILPGDSAVVSVTDPAAGLAVDGDQPAVYCWVNVKSNSGTDATVAGNPSLLTEDAGRWPVGGGVVYGSAGDTWYPVQLDTCKTPNGGVVEDRFNVDLNDALFVPGDTISFFFSAENTNAVINYWSAAWGTSTDPDESADNADECTILPAAGYIRGGDVLYVDGMNFRGAQPYFDNSLKQLAIFDKTDRYDIRGPSSGVGNRPGSRVVNVFNQLHGVYKKIIWSTGNLSIGLIGDGTGVTPPEQDGAEKSDDAAMLLNFLDLMPNTGAVSGGVYFTGDNIAEELESPADAEMISLKSYITHDLTTGDHITLGYGYTPLVIGTSETIFNHGSPNFADSLFAYGGCALINNFDVLSPTGDAKSGMTYEGDGPTRSAVIEQLTANAIPATVGVVLSGFSFHYIRDASTHAGYSDRSHHLRDILVYLGNTPPQPTPATQTFRTSLSQNYPNPFNPTTVIDFTVKELAPVSVKIYNVRGQLVKTLANDRFAPGVTHQLSWDGRNDAGQAVSSGVYFYKLVTKNFTQTKKMVLLK